MLSNFLGFFTHKDKEIRDNRWIFICILVFGLLSLFAAFVLSVEAFELIKNPNVILGCSINVIINCATVAKSVYATLFGFPNSFLGLMAMPVFITIAIAGLYGVKFPRTFMIGAQLAFTFSIIFAYILFYISSFIIQALCPWCMLVMLSSTVMFFAITRYNIRENNLFLSNRVEKIAKNIIEKDYDRFALALIIVAVISFIIIKYGSSLFA